MSYIFCFDLGLSHTGVAFADASGLPVTLPSIESKQPLKSIKSILSSYSADKIILSIPSSGPIVELAQEYKQELERDYPNKVILFNEDFSTQSASRKLYEAKFSLSDRRKKEHSAAAAQILTNFMEETV